jgi:uncharacterized protein GlcG (DUF336 family)
MRNRFRHFAFLPMLAAASLALLAAPQASVAEEHLVTSKSLSPEMALKLARATMAACRKASLQVAVAVVDRSGVMQVMLRDRFAGPHTPETARRKAWTAVSFRTDTTQMAANTKAGMEASGARGVTGALMLGGGVMVRAGGALVGGVGVSGAPSGKLDEDCAKTAIAEIQADLDF